MQDEKLLSELEKLNVTLGALNDTISVTGEDKTCGSALTELGDNIVAFNSEFGRDGVIERMVRMNRELTAQFEAIRWIVDQDRPILVTVPDEDGNGGGQRIL